MSSEDLMARIDAVRKRAGVELPARIVSVMSGKGGVGKTLLALELAWLLDAVLADLDWDGGGATRAMGHLHEKYVRAPLLDALETGKPPRPKKLIRRPDLVPSHPDLEANQPEPDAMASLLVSWSREWARPVVCDTHPGGSPTTLGACAASDLVVMPVVLGTRELNALEQTLAELGSYPLLLVPNWVPFSPPETERKRLRRIAETYQARVSTAFIREHRWLRTRRLRTVITAAPVFGVRTAALAEDLVPLAEEVLNLAR